MNVPANLHYTKEHEWLRIEGDEAEVGITDYAQNELGDVVFVELPGAGDEFAAGDSFGSLESVKAVSETYMPVSGPILDVNGTLEDAPELINEDPYEKGWIIKVKVEDPDQLQDLMTAEQYIEYLKEVE